MSTMLSHIMTALVWAVSELLDLDKVSGDSVLGGYIEYADVRDFQEDNLELTTGEWALVRDVIFYIREGDLEIAAEKLAEYSGYAVSIEEALELVDRLAVNVPDWHANWDDAATYWASKRWDASFYGKRELYAEDGYDGGDIIETERSKINVSLRAHFLLTGTPHVHGCRVYRAHKWVWPVFDAGWAREQIEALVDSGKQGGNGVVIMPTYMIQVGDKKQRVYGLNPKHWPKFFKERASKVEVIGLVGHTALFKVSSHLGRIWKARSITDKNLWLLDKSPALQSRCQRNLSEGVRIVDHPMMWRGQDEEDSFGNPGDALYVLAVPFWNKDYTYYQGEVQQERDPARKFDLKSVPYVILAQDAPEHILEISPRMVQDAAAERRRSR